MPHGGPHLPGGESLTTDDEGNVTGSPEEEFQVTQTDGQGPSPIGVPATVRGPGGQTVPFQAIVERQAPVSYGTGGGLLEGTDRRRRMGAYQTGVPPQYYDGHEKQPALFNIRSTEDRLRTQLLLEEAGLLDEYSPGQWDENTWKAFRDVLEHANVNGTDWKVALNQLVMNPRTDKDGGRGGQRGRRGYLAPDMAAVKQRVKQTFREYLGREPEDWELTLLGGELQGGFQEQMMMQQQIDQYEQQPAGEGEGPGQTFTDVDPKARFQEKFEELYRPEIEAEQREEDASTNTQLLMRSITGMDRTVGA